MDEEDVDEESMEEIQSKGFVSSEDLS